MKLFARFLFIGLAFIYVLVFCASLFDEYHWTLSVITHFQLQLFISGFVIAPFIFMVEKHKIWTILVILSALGAYTQTRLPMADPFAFSPPELKTENTLKIAQYNKYYGNKPYEDIAQWVKEQNIDILVMQEVVRENLLPFKNALKEQLPYMLPKGSHRPDAVVIFSRYEAIDFEIKNICKEHCKTHAVRFQISPKEGQTINFYSVHANAPVIENQANANKEELISTALWIAENQHENTVLIGDLNTTPYSYNYQEMLRISGLQYQNYHFWPEVTWPSWNKYSLLKIPIDHILYSPSMVLLDIDSGQQFGSDHHSLIATFALE